MGLNSLVIHEHQRFKQLMEDTDHPKDTIITEGANGNREDVKNVEETENDKEKEEDIEEKMEEEKEEGEEEEDEEKVEEDFRPDYLEHWKAQRRWSSVRPGKRQKINAEHYIQPAKRFPSEKANSVKQQVNQLLNAKVGLVFPIAMPMIRYRQRAEEGDTCLFASMASCLFFMKREKKAKFIYDNRQRSLTVPNRFELLIKLMGKEGRLNTAAYTFKNYNPLTTRSKHPTACQLLAKDGGIEHAVTFYRNYIFDSCEERVMHLNKEDNLKKCTGSGYAGSFIAIRFQHGKNK